MILLNLVKRNLMLYFNDQKRVFFSLIGVLISIILYLVFLKKMIQSGFSSIPDGAKLLDDWLIGGTLLLAAITTTGDSLHQKLYDRDSGRLKDLLITDASYIQIDVSYIISSWIIGCVMQLFVYLILSIVFMISDGVVMELSLLPQLLLGMLISSLVWTLFNMCIFMFIKSSSLIPSISAIISSCAGFFAGVYLPIGALPNKAQLFLSYTPAPYGSAMFRNVLMNTQIKSSFQHVSPHVVNSFLKTMGLQVNGISTFVGNIMVSGMFTFVLLCLILVLSLRNRHKF